LAVGELKNMDLTDEQIKLISVYWKKWQTLAISTEPVNQEQMAKVVNLLYQAAGLDQPELIFAASPNQYYAQGFLSSMLDSIKESLEPILRSNSNNIFIEEHQQNIAMRLGRQLLLPIERLKTSYLRKALEKIRKGKNRSKALSEAFAEVYSKENEQTLNIVAQVDRQFVEQCGASNNNSLLHVSQDSSWIGCIYDVLNSNLKIPRELLCQAIDIGYNSSDFSGIQVGCIDRVLLAFASSRLDYFKNVLGFQGILEEEIAQLLVRCAGSMFFPYEKTCVLCDSPRIISFNDEAYLDFRKATFIQFSDGFTIC
jgi:hypothetical protein